MRTAIPPHKVSMEVATASIHVGIDCLVAACELESLDPGGTCFCKPDNKQAFVDQSQGPTLTADVCL